MDKFCKNHPYSNAHWFCKKCQSSYCFSCVGKKLIKFSKNETYVHICPSCKRMVEWTGIQHISDNIALTMLKALLYPLSPFAFIVILVLSCFGMLFSNNLYSNEALFALIWGVIFSYSLNSLSHSVSGKNSPPSFSAIPVSELMNHIILVFKQTIIMLFIAVVFLGFMTMEKRNLAYLFLGIFSFITPFVLMKNITSSGLRSYFDLLSFFHVFRKTTLIYLTAALLSPIVISIFYLFTILQPGVVTFIVCYSMVVIYRLLSQIILKCHKELNYSINYEHFKNKYSLETLHGFKA